MFLKDTNTEKLGRQFDITPTQYRIGKNALVIVEQTAALWNAIPVDTRKSQNLRNFRISVNSGNV